MLGLIPLTLAEMAERALGPDAMPDLMVDAGLPPDLRFRIDRIYADGGTLALIGAIQNRLGIDLETAYDAYARHFLADALVRFPAFFRMSPTARDFLIRQPRIHHCMAAGVGTAAERAAIAAKFEVEEQADGALITTYRSQNRLARFYVALARRVIEHYGEAARVEPLDDPHGTEVRIRISWEGAHG